MKVVYVPFWRICIARIEHRYHYKAKTFNMKLTIVVPVYNVEQYVRKCILSIINQDDDLFKTIELIIVNDGTKDKSVEQIQDLVDEYDNIILVNQENAGLSVARNNGLKIAKGDYVWFIDSDDWISCDALKVLFPYLDNKNDIVPFAYTQVTESKERLCCKYCDKATTFSGKDTFRNRCVFGTMAQRAAYRKDFLAKNKLVFKPGIYSQDDELCLRASYLAETVTLIPQSIYYFLRTTGDKHKSIMNAASPKYGFDYITVTKSLLNFKKEYVKEDDLSKIFDYHISVLINNGLNAITKCSKEDQNKFTKMYREEKELTSCLFGGGGKYLIEAILFTIFPNKMVEIYNIMKKFK